MGGFSRIPLCPRIYGFDTDRYVAAGYLDAQWRPFEKVTLDGGVRIQKGFGQLPYDLVPLGSAAIVYNFLPDYHIKLNYATGFRSPVFQNTSIPAGGISYGSNPNLQTESSQSFQGELNARLLRNIRKVRELEVRVDYSYTVLSDLIQIEGGTYGNTGKRAIHSVEGYAKLYLNGDHFLQASYTYLNTTTTDSGTVRTTPNHWAVLGASFNIVKNLLDINANLRVFGAYEDPNRYPTGVGHGVSAARRWATRHDDGADDRPHIRSSDAGGKPAARLPPALLEGQAAVLGSVLQRAQSALLLHRPVRRPDAHRRDDAEPGARFQFLREPVVPLLIASAA